MKIILVLLELLCYISIIKSNNYDDDVYTYNVLPDLSECLSCPLVKNDDIEKVSMWFADYLDDGKQKNVWFCRDGFTANSTDQQSLVNSIRYRCERTRLCLDEFKSYYPKKYSCISDGSSAIGQVKVNMLSK